MRLRRPQTCQYGHCMAARRGDGAQYCPTHEQVVMSRAYRAEEQRMLARLAVYVTPGPRMAHPMTPEERAGRRIA